MKKVSLTHRRGIGAGIALELGNRGANVVVNHSSEKSGSAGAAVVKSILAAGSRAVLVHANVVSQPDISKLVKAALELSPSGKIDIIVHNAGHGDDCFLEDITEDFYTTQTDINLKGLSLTPDNLNFHELILQVPFFSLKPHCHILAKVVALL